MKKILLPIAAFSVLILASCATTGASVSDTSVAQESSFIYNIPKDTEFEVMKNVSGMITGYKANQKSVQKNGNTYSPTNSNTVIFLAEIEILNNTDKDLTSISYNGIELAAADESGEISFSRCQIPGDTLSMFTANQSNSFLGRKKIAPGKSFKDSVSFIYKKGLTPVAITKDRVPVFTMYNSKTANAEIIDKNLCKFVHLNECFEMVKTSSVEEIEEFMNKYGIKYSDTNNKGESFVQLAIVNKNNKLLDKALEAGCDLSATYRLGSGIALDSLDLLGIAAITCNKYACDKLMEKGLTIPPAEKSGAVNPAVVAVRQNNLLTLIFISEVLKVDVAHLKIPMGWSSMDILNFCNQRKQTQMADYITQLRNKE